jgi:dsDNA-specific endonuclease/ATPase MutS2
VDSPGLEIGSPEESDTETMSIFNWSTKPKTSSIYNEPDEYPDPENPFPDPVVIEITDVFDLHSIQPRETKSVVKEYLQQAHDKGFTTVRIIHGKGIGVQREIVRSILAETEFVADWTNAPEGGGSWGATIVRFRRG